MALNQKKPVNNKKLNEKFRKLGNMKMNISKPPKKTISTPKPQTDSGARMTVPKNQVFNFKINNNKNNKLTPKKPKTNNGVNNMNVNNGANNMNVNNGANNMNINARTELNKLTSLRPNQKNNYLKKINETPNKILRILIDIYN